MTDGLRRVRPSRRPRPAGWTGVRRGTAADVGRRRRGLPGRPPAARPGSRPAAGGDGAARSSIDDGEHRALEGGRPVEPGDALVVATSGSTGAPEGCRPHPRRRARRRRGPAHDRLGVGPDDHWLACLPLAHVGGLSVVTRALLTGMRLTVHDRLRPGRRRRRPAATPRLARRRPRCAASTRRRSARSCSAAARRRPTARRTPSTTYGMTETGSGVVYDGVPLDGVEVRVAADGEIQLRAPMLLRAYRDGSDAVASTVVRHR